MVYESDFYTNRRPYSRPSVPITSYSVTPKRIIPGVGKAHTYHSSIPSIAHKRMNNLTTPVPHSSTRNAVIDNTLDRIYHTPRSYPTYDPMDDFLNERSVTSFDDVSRSIRANTAALLKKVHTPIPRAIRPLSVANQYDHIQTPISERISSDEYIWHLLRPLPGHPSNGIEVGYYPETSVRVPLGKTHLACLSYAGSHPISKRKQLVAGPGDDYRNVRKDVELLSHYYKMRTAANHPHENGDENSEIRNAGASVKSYKTTPTATHKALKNDIIKSMNDDEEKENIATPPRKKSLRKTQSKNVSGYYDHNVEYESKSSKKKLSRDASRDYNDEAEDERMHGAEEARLTSERAAAEELTRKLEAERLVEEERLAEEVRLAREQEEEAEQRAKDTRLMEEERNAEAQQLAEEKRLAEEARLAEEESKVKQTRVIEEKRRTEEEQLAEEELLAEEQRLKEEQQKLLEEQLIEEYHCEQETKTECERRYTEELRSKTKEKQQKILEVQQQQECQGAGEDTEETEEEEEDEVANKKSESESGAASEEEPAIAEHYTQQKITDVQEVRNNTKQFTVSSSFNNHNEDEDDEKSANTDANSEISEAEEKFESDTQNKESEIIAEPKVESPEESEEESE